MNILVKCVNCNDLVLIYKEDINCGIFRHGIMKGTNKQIDSHLGRKECEDLKKKDLIYGCGKPFILKEKDNIYWTEKCDYI